MTMWKVVGGIMHLMKEAGQGGASINAFCTTSLTSCSGITHMTSHHLESIITLDILGWAY